MEVCFRALKKFPKFYTAKGQSYSGFLSGYFANISNAFKPVCCNVKFLIKFLWMGLLSFVNAVTLPPFAAFILEDISISILDGRNIKKICLHSHTQKLDCYWAVPTGARKKTHSTIQTSSSLFNSFIASNRYSSVMTALLPPRPFLLPPPPSPPPS